MLNRNRHFRKSPHYVPLNEEQGFSLVELIMTIVILGLTSLILIPFFNSISHSPDPIIRLRAIALGQAMMDEVMSKKWDETTPNGGGPICTQTESGTGRGNDSYTLDCATELVKIASSITADGEVRTAFDDVDDYNGLDESDNFTDLNGDTFTFTGYRRQVSVRYIPSDTDPVEHDNPAGATTSAQSTDSKRIVVKISTPLNEELNFVLVVCNL